MVMALCLAGCVADEDPPVQDVEVPDNAVTTNADALVALLNVSALEGEAPLDLVIDYDVYTTFDDVEWTLTLEDKARFTVFHMGSGGLDKLPGQRNFTLDQGTYLVMLDVASNNETSQAFATVTVELDPDGCYTPPEYLAVTAGGERHYIVGEGDEIWQESTGDEDLQTPESCPNGPHDTQIK